MLRNLRQSAGRSVNGAVRAESSCLSTHGLWPPPALFFLKKKNSTTAEDNVEKAKSSEKGGCSWKNG